MIYESRSRLGTPQATPEMSARPQYTEQQAAAILARDVSVALSAGAGCGKTFVLTQRFLQQLEPGQQTAELTTLVAITFTDRAAREMRDRVREACQERLESCDSVHVDHWLNVLRGLDTARISTIHSFCTSLLRTHAVEAALDPRFSVLEPPLADSLLNSATENVVHQRLIDDDPDAVAFVVRFGLERTRDLVARLASERFRIDWSSWDGLTTDDLAQAWIQQFEREFVPRLINEFRETSAWQQLKAILAEEQPTHAEMQRRCTELQVRLDPTYTWKNPSAELDEILKVARVQGGGTKTHWSSPEVFEEVKILLTQLRKAAEDLRDQLEYDADDVQVAADFALRGVRLARDIAVAYNQAKRQAGTLDFDDLLLRARDLLREHPEVCQRFARGIKLLMVDEFQDTDPVQAEIVRSLCGAALRQGKLFLVGDIKQSIYRFRRADPRVFRALRDELPAAGQLSLTKNFRSQPAILNFVNALFATEFAGYESLQPFRDEQLSPQPAIEFLFATFDDQVDVGSESVKPTARELRRREANWMARRIVELLDDPTPRVRERVNGQTQLRRVRQGDIVILFRALTNVQEYESELRRYGIDYYLVGGKAFFAQQEVFDILNLCRCLDDPDDTVALIGVLRSPLFALPDDALQALLPPDGDWFSRLQQPPPPFLPEFQRERISFAGRTLVELRAQKNRISIAELLKSAVARTGYDAALLTEFLGNRKVANLKKLIDQAETFDRSELFTLKDFVERLQSSVLEETDEEFATTLPETGEVVRLMTVHQSKGLEFPVVIVADIDRKGPPRTPSAYLHPAWGALINLPEQFGSKRENLALRMHKIEETAAEEEESLRLFYVAVTRAADHLIISAGIEPEARRNSAWTKLLERKFHFETGQPVGDPLLGTTIGITSRAEVPIILPHHKPAVVPQPQNERGVSLSSVIDAVHKAEPMPLPESMTVFGCDVAAPRQWSVSELEQWDAIAAPRPIVPRELAPVTANGPPAALSASEEFGTLVHAMLEQIDYARLSDWSKACDDAVRNFPRDVTDEMALSARTIVGHFVESPLAREIARSRQVHTEIDFVCPWMSPSATGSQDQIAGQIDLCFESADGSWVIVDFKTGSVSPKQSDSDLLAPYSFQLGVYAWALGSWLNSPVERVTLVHLRPHVRQIALEWNAATQAKLLQRLDRSITLGRSTP